MKELFSLCVLEVNALKCAAAILLFYFLFSSAITWNLILANMLQVGKWLGTRGIQNRSHALSDCIICQTSVVGFKQAFSLPSIPFLWTLLKIVHKIFVCVGGKLYPSNYSILLVTSVLSTVYVYYHSWTAKYWVIIFIIIIIY